MNKNDMLIGPGGKNDTILGKVLEKGIHCLYIVRFFFQGLRQALNPALQHCSDPECTAVPSQYVG